MKQLGDITNINGAQIEPVDCITFGSPCQDLSVAGRRAGLDGERSGLFMQAVRVIREMREATNGMYPTFAVWENVPGAFSSNGGEDFRTVLEQLACIEQPGTTIPRPGWRWSRAGYIRGSGWSIAWRLLDAQYWGVPQRRKRIALVVDFRGERAGEILFERESVRGHPAPGISPWEGTARNPTAGVGADNREGRAYTLKIRSGCEGGGKGALVQTERSATLSTLQDQTLFVPDTSGTLTATYAKSNFHKGEDPIVCEASGFSYGQSAQARSLGYENEVVVDYQTTHWIVRRLTPTECERLQGYPDGWTDIGEWTDSKGRRRKPADTPRYKALGNSIALPQWWWLTCKMAAYLPTGATLGSLFDGIGGFPLVWETRHGKGTARWASEIDEFCIAVTKARFEDG